MDSKGELSLYCVISCRLIEKVDGENEDPYIPEVSLQTLVQLALEYMVSWILV